MKVNGPGVPGNTTITVGSDQHSVTLNPPSGTSISTPAGVQQFTFTSTNPISPSLRYTQPGYTITDGSSSAGNGVVMWYQSLTAENPNNDAPFQLIEMSFRGTYYNPKINVGTGFNYLIGFDTKERITSVPMISTWSTTTSRMSTPLPCRWPWKRPRFPFPTRRNRSRLAGLGRRMSIGELQDAFTNFVGSNSSVASYFGGQGYPSYSRPASVDTIKLPSGQNLFFQSPFNTGSNQSSFASTRLFLPLPAARACSSLFMR